jgi:DNA-binding LacI/PurR family transcriptional regulator
MGNNKKAPPRIAQIAEKLGVSRSTVSYVMNDKWSKRGISEATAKRILDYVKETGFLPNPASLALKGKSVKEIAVLVPPNPLEHQKKAFFSLLAGLEERGKSYMMLPLTEEGLPETVQFIKMYRIPKVMVICSAYCWQFKEKWIRFLKNITGIDFFYYEFPFEHADPSVFHFSKDCLSVGFNRTEARLKALKYILDRGYRFIAVPNIFNEIRRDKRLKIDSGVEFLNYEINSGNLFDMGLFVAKQLPALKKKTKGPLAVYVNDDLMSAAIMKYLREKGFSIPGDFALLSWDGLPESNYFTVPLSTCVMPHEEMLKTGLKWIDGEIFPKNQLLFDIKIREGQTLPSVL